MNKLICIGSIGHYLCYLNVTKEEALAQHQINEPDDFTDDGFLCDYLIIDVIEFDKVFQSYASWEYE